jgi:translation initiation factor IF-3
VVKNEAISLAEVLYIDENNTRQGVFAPSELLARLDRRRFDLVLVNETHTPPIVRPLPRLIRAAPSRMKLREKEFHFGTTMATRDAEIRMARVREYLGRAYRIRLVVEGRRGERVGRETVLRRLIGELREEMGKDLVVGQTEGVAGSLVTMIHSASAKPPSTKPVHEHEREREHEHESESESE